MCILYLYNILLFIHKSVTLKTLCIYRGENQWKGTENITEEISQKKVAKMKNDFQAEKREMRNSQSSQNGCLFQDLFVKFSHASDWPQSGGRKLGQAELPPNNSY